MTRLGIMVWFVLVLGAGLTTFTVKYAVQNVEDQLNRVRKQTIVERQEIRVLNAEWTYLNQPERLAELNQRFLGLVPITARQLQQSIADIPLRAPEPAPAPDVVVAANPEPVTPPPPASQPAIAPVAYSSVSAPAAVPGKTKPDAAPTSLDALIAQAADATNPEPAAPQNPASQPATAPVAYGPVPTPAAAPTAAATTVAVPISAVPISATPVQLARAEPNAAPNSLDALIAQIAEAK